MADEAVQVGQAMDAWADLGPTRPSSCSAPPELPSARTIEIMTKLGLRYPPANSVDRDSHAARVMLLAEDCADIPEEWLDFAAREWAKDQPFFPRTCELREIALRHGRLQTQGRALPAPHTPHTPPPPKPIPPPLTDDEIAKLSPKLIEMGVKLGEIDPQVAQRIRDAA